MLTFIGTVGALCGVGFGAWAGAGTLAFVLSQSMYGSMVTACYCSKLSIPLLCKHLWFYITHVEYINYFEVDFIDQYFTLTLLSFIAHFAWVSTFAFYLLDFQQELFFPLFSIWKS